MRTSPRVPWIESVFFVVGLNETQVMTDSIKEPVDFVWGDFLGLKLLV